jgi:hypothetical protein
MMELLRGCVVCIRTGWSDVSNVIRFIFPALCVFLCATSLEGQIQVDLKFKRLQYIAYEPVVATVYATYSLGRTISFEQPQAEIDHANQLHVLHCAAPRAWSYARIGLNGELPEHSSFMETKTRPRLVHSGNGEIAVRGGMIEAPGRSSGTKSPKLSARPPAEPTNDR